MNTARRVTWFLLIALCGSPSPAQQLQKSSLTDDPVFGREASFTLVSAQRGPGEEVFCDLAGEECEVVGDKAVLRFQLKKGAEEPDPLAILERHDAIARGAGGWSYEYTPNTRFVGLVKEGREIWARVFVGDEYYELTVVSRPAGAAVAGASSGPAPAAPAGAASGAAMGSAPAAAGTGGQPAVGSAHVGGAAPAVGPASAGADMGAASGSGGGGLAVGTPGTGSPSGGAIGEPSGQGTGGASGTLRITQPTEGAILYAGEATEVRWATDGSVPRVDVGYSYREQGAAAEPRFAPLATNVANTGAQSITLPAPINSGGLPGYSIEVRAAGGSAATASRMAVHIRPRVDLWMYPTTKLEQFRRQGMGGGWGSSMRLTVDFINQGIATLDHVSVRVVFIVQATEQRVFDGTIASVPGFFGPGSPQSQAVQFIPLADGHTLSVPLGGDQAAGSGQSMGSDDLAGGATIQRGRDYRVEIDVLAAGESPSLLGNNRRTLFFTYR
jgi:hypothetical protein